jgi:hypothetical protein
MLKNLIKILVSFLLVGTLFVVIWHNRWWFYDEYRLYGYTPPSSIVALVDQDKFTPYARRLFYVYHPALETSSTFNQNCNVTPKVIVLGCTVIDKGIYIYNVTDPTLNGINQVTAAYEMLHVGYSRLSDSKRNYIDNLVISTYQRLSVSNPLLKSEYESYLMTEGQGAINNEMHSTLATQIKVLPATLENYYKQYFVNRQIIVNEEASYQSAFTTRQDMINTDDKELQSIKNQIDANNQVILKDLDTINNLQVTLNSYKQQSNVSAYNQTVITYNNLVNTYNSLIETNKGLVDQYNTLVAKRNSIALSEDKLTNEINSLSTTQIAN